VLPANLNSSNGGRKSWQRLFWQKKKKPNFAAISTQKKKSLTLLKHLQTNPLTQNIQENVQTPEIKPI
jgi:ribosomal protein L25 (general stress protein Ctc)